MDDLLPSLVSWDGGLTLLPPLVAIALALMTKRVLPSLAAAVVIGGIVATSGDVVGALPLLGGITVGVLSDTDNLTVCAFSLLVAATVGVMGRSGGTRALVGRLQRLARGRRGAMTTSWLAGAVVFFDDYANCLVVGSAMGPLCDRSRVSRAKLAYIVDATAAPLASLAVVSTWVGYEVGLIGKALEPTASTAQAFPLFLEALPYRSYCILTLVFVGAIALSGRDFGPMRAAEERVLAHPEAPDAEAEAAAEAAAASPWLAALPVGLLVLTTFAMLLQGGRTALGPDAAEARLFEIIGAADPYRSMLVGAGVAWVSAAGLSLGLRALAPRELGDASWSGMRKVLEALAVLLLAWTLGDVIEATGAAEWIASALGDRLAPAWLPAITFVLAAGTAFSTGSSFFTMGTLIPLVVPLAVTLEGAGVPGPVLLASTAAVLDGAVLGDHASPISDTTILSSLGSAVDVVTHVRTQLPYALTVGVVAVLLGSLPAGMGFSPWWTMLLGSVVCVGIVLGVGRVPTAPAPTPPG